MRRARYGARPVAGVSILVGCALALTGTEAARAAYPTVEWYQRTGPSANRHDTLLGKFVHPKTTVVRDEQPP